MIVCNGIDAFPADGLASVATVGNFDGVHRGHQAILRSITREARRTGTRSVLVTFDPHPLSVVAPERRPMLIQTRRQKLAALEDAGLDAVVILRFDANLAALSGEAFFAETLGDRLRIRSAHVGQNFRFGRGRSADLETLRGIGIRRGFEVVGVPQIEHDGERISSSVIRRTLEAGDVERGRLMLGRPYAIEGTVVRGEGRGHSLDFPTANLSVDNELIPRGGVYITETMALAGRHPSVTNVGVRPTFGGTTLVIEAHILDFDDDLYGERVELRFLARLRDEKRFGSKAALADQIARDRAAAAAFFESVPPQIR